MHSLPYGISTIKIIRRKMMTIENRNLTVGTKLVARYHKESHSCEVIQGENNKLNYRLEDGREFKSPSAAGMAITGHACDGWVFWKVETQAVPSPATETQNKENTSTADNALAMVPCTAVAQEQTEDLVTTATQDVQESITATKKNFHRTPNQKGVSEGQTRWYCQTCVESFLAPYGEVPLGCPQGHKA
jgi:hypothetical protein